VDVVAADIFEFLADQRGDRKVIRLSDGESGMSARTIARRLSSVSGFYSYVIARDATSLRANRCCGVSPPAGRAAGQGVFRWFVFPQAPEDPLAG